MGRELDPVPPPVDTVGNAPTIGSVWAEVTGGPLRDPTLEWPADVFAVVGTVLGRTHAYRFAVSPPPGRQWPPLGSGWNGAVCAAGERWAAWAEDPEGPPPGWSPTPGRCSGNGRRRRWTTSRTARTGRCARRC
ncbi:hypothetical protein [Blastococcus sp. PRF04-17]|uniref:hypothetical protein n=1 Tax=Blastococcus sp. PRF04-17 TaxID=2933797 RepID=UPI001FF5E057|nr:hypothetical protein [Blastococcus sp. PRF04-17]UOY03598.1 hypothetical protein MVA48_09820 [Blastococcus sp. PRF04-17]